MKFFKLVVIANVFFTTICTAQNFAYTFLFDSGKYKVAPFEAREFYTKLKGLQADSVTIQGHCDSIGSDAYNLILSKQRVAAIKNMLVNLGIKKQNIKIATGYGETQPMVNNTTDSNRLLNRRVVVYVNEVSKIIIPKPEPKIKIKKNQKPEIIAAKEKLPIIAKPVELKNAKFKSGEKIYLPNLTFQGNRHFLTLEGEEAWKELLQKIKQNPTIKFEIIGHICCTNPELGDAMDFDESTPNLSLNRAKEIYDRFIEAGVDKNRMKYLGKGSTERIYPDELTSLESAMNRRVEILIVN